MYRIVNTDNFGSDYPDEKFVGEPFDTREEAQEEADKLNGDYDYHPRYYMVVEMPYELRPGFEP